MYPVVVHILHVNSTIKQHHDVNVFKTACPILSKMLYAQEEAALHVSPLTALHTHRKVLGVIGVCHCPEHQSLSEAYDKFETKAKSAFNPSDFSSFACQIS